MTDTEKQNIMNEYLENEGKKLKKLVYPLMMPIVGVCQKDYDDFFSNSSIILWRLLDKYDISIGIPFQKYLQSCLKKRFITWGLRDANRFKRKNLVKAKDKNGNPVYEMLPDTSIDSPVGDEGNLTIGDMLIGSVDIDSELINGISDAAEQYLNALTVGPRKIADLMIDGYSAKEIKEILGLTDYQYKRRLSFMQKPDKKRLLKQNHYNDVGEDKQLQTQTMEKSKETQYSITSLIKKIDGYTFRFDHPTQRESGRWTLQMKGNLISDILQNNPLPHLIFAEQIINGVAVTWNLDGKQKSTNVYDFSNNEFKICKNIRRWEIEYQTKKKDENGKIILQNNIPVFETHIFDIRGKRYKDLPDELQERFCDYTFQCTQYFNCSDKDIEYHICRYNEGVRLNGTEKGMGEIGTKFAAMIKEIAAMPFFTERGGYKVSEFNDGTMNRVVAESIMAINFLDEWRKRPEDMCSFMKDKVNEEIFETFTDMVDRLEQVLPEDIFDMFNSKDSFIYFGLFSRFANIGLDDKRFVDFMIEFSESLHSKEIEGITYDSLCINEKGKSTSNKDKAVAVAKINFLEKLMLAYFSISIDETQTEDNCVLEFVRENVVPDIEQEDIEFYEMMLEDLSLNVDNNTKLLEENNKPSLLALVAYSCQEDINLDGWFVNFFNKNNNYIAQQHDNYIFMREDLENYNI